MGKLKRNVCVAEGDCLLFRVPRGDCTAGYYTSPPARAGNGSFCRRGARGKTNGIQSVAPARGGNGQFREPGGAIPRGEVCKIGEAPARGAARSAAGGRRRRPKAGDAFRGGVTRSAPLDANPAGGMRHFPPKAFPRNASCPPRGRGNKRFLLSFIGCARSARLPELSVTRLRAIAIL